MKFVRFQDTPISIIIIPLHINNKNWECHFKFQINETKEVFAQFNLNGKAPAVGSLQGKWEYIFANVGKELGQYLEIKLKEIYQ